jgi:perosamine synthetase
MMKFIPYGRQSIEKDDIQAVIDVLQSDWLTTGPTVGRFETEFAAYTTAPHAVAVSNGTAALHAAYHAIGLGPGDEIIVPPMTFAATANAALYVGAKPVFSDVADDTLLLNPAEVESKITSRTKAIVAVDYAGQPCDYQALRKIADHHGLKLIADACHALGAQYQGKNIGTVADLSCFSFHPVKHITTAEGGMITTADSEFARKMRIFRNHGISSDHRQRSEVGTLHYEMVDLGYNYRLSDFQCALGISQLSKQPGWLERRQAIAAQYDAAFQAMSWIKPLRVSPDVKHAYHLYVIQLELEALKQTRDQVYQAVRKLGIGANVHYPPVHLHPYYRSKFGYKEGAFPNTEKAYHRILSLPMYPAMTDDDVRTVVQAFKSVF